MSEQRVPWSTIAVGDLVLGARDGKEWRVAELVDGQVVLEREDRKAKIPLPAGAVTRLATAAQASERALAVLQVVLGGEVVAKAPRTPDDKGHSCPATYTQPSALASHIYLFHGQPDAWGYPGGRWGAGRSDVTDPASELTMSQLVALHAQFHEDMAAGSARAGTIKHWHDPMFDEAGL